MWDLSGQVNTLLRRVKGKGGRKGKGRKGRGEGREGGGKGGVREERGTCVTV